MFSFEDRIDLIFKTGFFNFQFNFSRALASRPNCSSLEGQRAPAASDNGARKGAVEAIAGLDLPCGVSRFPARLIVALSPAALGGPEGC